MTNDDVDPELFNDEIHMPEAEYYELSEQQKKAYRKAMDPDVHPWWVLKHAIKANWNRIKPKREPMLKWLKRRFKEPGTYKAVSMLLGLLGVSVSPDMWQPISTAVVALISLIQIGQKEKSDEEHDKDEKQSNG